MSSALFKIRLLGDKIIAFGSHGVNRTLVSGQVLHGIVCG